MFRKFRLPYLVALLVIPALILSGCNLGGKSGKGGQVLTLTEAAEPPNLDSAKSTDASSIRVLNNTMEGLYRKGENGKPELAMAAEEPTISEDKKVYTFKIRDAKWSNGDPITAHDFQYAWLRALNPKTASEYAYILYYIENAEAYNTGKKKPEDVGVKALDDKTLEVRLKAPIPFFKDLLSFVTYFPQSEKVVKKHGSKYALEPEYLVYNGPFVLTQWRHNKELQLKKNDAYWDKNAVKLKEVNLMIVKEASTGLNLYTNEKVDFTDLGPEFIDKYKKDPEIMFVKDASTFYLEMNQRPKPNNPLINANIRKAIAQGINKQDLTDKVLKEGKPAGRIVHPDMLKASETNDVIRQEDLANIKYNPAEAKKAFQKGLQELGVTKIRKLEFVADDTPRGKKSVEYISEQLRTNLGIETTNTIVPFKQRLEKGKRGQFDLLVSGWGPDFNDPISDLDLFESGSSFNHGKWSNKEFDRLMEKSSTNPNFEERLHELVKAERILTDDAAVAPLYFRARPALLKSHVKGIVWNAIGSDYDLKKAYIEEGK